MKIEVWSDFICPFCYIGKRNLENALSQVSHREQVEVEFKSFELDPNQPLYSGKSMNEILAKKYGMSIEEAKSANESVGRQAASVGLNYNLVEMKPTNTFDAHRLTKYAKTVGKEKEWTEKIFYAYFTESMLISDQDTLADLAVSAGMDRGAVIAVLKDGTKHTSEVRSDEAQAHQIGVTGVPFFRINEKYTISGAQPKEVFENVLQKAWEDEQRELMD